MLGFYWKIRNGRETILRPVLTQLRELQERELRADPRLGEIDAEIAKLTDQNLVLTRLKSKGYLDSDLYLSQMDELNARARELRRLRRSILEKTGEDEQIRRTEEMLEYLESGDPIYVLIYMHYGEHDGKTVYWITIPIDKRPRPTNLQPNFEEQTVISQTIAALQDAAARAEQNADDAEASKEAIQNMHVQAAV